VTVISEQIDQRADAHLPKFGEAVADAAFDDVLEVNHSQELIVLGDGRAACRPLSVITGDNPLTAAAIAAESGVDDFLALTDIDPMASSP
jgi:hypothetical protein